MKEFQIQDQCEGVAWLGEPIYAWSYHACHIYLVRVLLICSPYVFLCSPDHAEHSQ